MKSKLEELFNEFMPEIEFIDASDKIKNNSKEGPALRFINPLEDYVPLVEVTHDCNTIVGLGKSMIARLKKKDKRETTFRKRIKKEA